MRVVKLAKRQLLAGFFIVALIVMYRSVEPASSIQAIQPISTEIAQVPMAQVPVKKSPLIEPVLNATAAYVTDEVSGAVLYSKNANTYYAPASTTKLMMALVARKVFQPSSVLTVQLADPVEGSKVGLRNGEQYSIETLLEAALIQSANDAAITIARADPAGEEAFVAKMNLTAKQLGLKDTHFSNPNGYDSPDHYSTARDLSILTRETLKDSFVRKTVGTSQLILADITDKRHFIVNTTNQLLAIDPRIHGVKTGTTEEAGEVLVTLVETEGHSLLFVVLGSHSRYTDTQTLIDWITTNYRWYAAEELVQKAALE